MSAIRLLMCMNQMDPSETTTQFRGASLLRYPPTLLPSLQRASPDNFVIAHYHVPPAILSFLEEDRPVFKDSGIEWVLLPTDLQGFYLFSHLPTRKKGPTRPFKSQAVEVRDGILSAPRSHPFLILSSF